MAKNLRDKGYPGTTQKGRFKSRVPKVIPGKAKGGTKKEIPYGTDAYWSSRPKTDIDEVIGYKGGDYANAVNKVLNKVKSPLSVESTKYLFQPDYNWGDRTETTTTLRAGNNRLGFVDKEHNFDPAKGNSYSVGIDNLPLGENTYSRSFNTPVGEVGADYDGDGTLVGYYNPKPSIYYLQAVANLLKN